VPPHITPRACTMRPVVQRPSVMRPPRYFKKFCSQHALSLKNALYGGMHVMVVMVEKARSSVLLELLASSSYGHQVYRQATPRDPATGYRPIWPVPTPGPVAGPR
jgi:hypothetical protein